MGGGGGGGGDMGTPARKLQYPRFNTHDYWSGCGLLFKPTERYPNLTSLVGTYVKTSCIPILST